MKKRAAKNDDKEARAEALFLRGAALYGEEHVEEALVEWRAAAALGNGDAMFNVALMHEQGQGVAKDVAEAHAWYKRAAAAGNPDAMTSLALDLRDGVPEAGIAPNRAEAVRLMRLAAECGISQSMFNLGKWLCEDNQNDPESVVWLRRAVEMGHKGAMAGLGKCFFHGMGGLEKSTATAVSWFLKAAELGEPAAMYNLGVCYFKGDGWEKNLTTAAEWLERAQKAGYEGALAQLDNVKKLIAEEQEAKKQTSSSSSTAITTSPCAACGKLADNRCSGCMEKFYCSHECQLAQWPEHKAACKAKQHPRKQ